MCTFCKSGTTWVQQIITLVRRRKGDRRLSSFSLVHGINLSERYYCRVQAGTIRRVIRLRCTVAFSGVEECIEILDPKTKGFNTSAKVDFVTTVPYSTKHNTPGDKYFRIKKKTGGTLCRVVYCFSVELPLRVNVDVFLTTRKEAETANWQNTFPGDAIAPPLRTVCPLLLCLSLP